MLHDGQRKLVGIIQMFNNYFSFQISPSKYLDFKSGDCSDVIMALRNPKKKVRGKEKSKDGQIFYFCIDTKMITDV
jgi:hypothetical protein